MFYHFVNGVFFCFRNIALTFFCCNFWNNCDLKNQSKKLIWLNNGHRNVNKAKKSNTNKNFIDKCEVHTDHGLIFSLKREKKPFFLLAILDWVWFQIDRLTNRINSKIQRKNDLHKKIILIELWFFNRFTFSMNFLLSVCVRAKHA